MAYVTADEMTHLSFPVVKVEKVDDGSGDLLVYGRVTDGTIDSDDQIVDPAWSAEALKNWLATGANLRVQHQAMRDPAGVGLTVDINRDGDQAHWLKALVVEPVAKRLVEKGALRAFSVGIMRPKILTHAKARGGMIAGGDLGEVSLVDRPANRNCAFSLVKAAKDGGAEWVGKMEGDQQVITKMLKPDPRDVAKAISNGKNTELPRPEQGSVPSAGRFFSDPISNRLAEAIAAEKAVEKREFSSERRQHDASTGAAMPHGGYPIENRSDLHNAIQAIGRAKNPGATRAHIRRRARALGASDAIPDSWGKSEYFEDEITKALDAGDMSIDEARVELGLAPWGLPETMIKGGTCPTCKGDGKIRGGGMACPDCKGSGKMKPPASKGMGPDGSAPGDDDDETGTGSGSPQQLRRKKPPGVSKNGYSGEDDDDDDDDGGDDSMPHGKRPKNKGDAWTCSACGTAAYKGAAFCSGCGAAFKGGDPAAGVMHKPGTARGPEPGSVEEAVAPTWESEPKGGDEPHGHGTGVWTGTGGGAVGSGNSTTLKTDAPYSIRRAHDAFCPAFSFADVLKEYPSLDTVLDALNVAEVKEAALKAVAGGQLGLGEGLLRVARGADELMAADKAEVTDARAALHKSFTEMYPSVHLTPGMVCATDFRRGYLSAGHAAGSAVPDGHSAPATEPPAAPHAASFSRGLITAGHQATSPGKMAAAEVIETVHDQISVMFAGRCPMSPEAVATAKGSGAVLPPFKAGENKKPSTATLVPPKGGKGGKKKPSMKAAAQQEAIEAAVRQLTAAVAGIGALKSEVGRDTVTAADAAAQLRELAAQLAEKSAHGTTGVAEVMGLREKIGELHGMIVAASQKERHGGEDTAVLKAAAEKLERAAEALAAHHGWQPPPQAASQLDIGGLQEQLRNLQSLVMAGAQKGSDGSSSSAELGSLRSQLGELQGMIMTAQLAQAQKGSGGGGGSGKRNSQELAAVGRQLGELQGMLSAQLAQKAAGGGSGSGNGRSKRDGRSSGELATVGRQLEELRTLIMSDRLAQKSAGGGAGPELAELRGKLGELQGMLMSGNLQKSGGEGSQEISALRSQLGELQGMISAQMAQKINGSNSSNGDGAASGDSRALAEAASQLTKAAGMLSERPAASSPWMSPTIPVQPVSRDRGTDVVEQKLDQLQDQLKRSLEDFGTQLIRSQERSTKVSGGDDALVQAYKGIAEQVTRGYSEINLIREQHAEQQRVREQHAEQQRLLREQLEDGRRGGRRDGSRKDVKALKSAAAQLTKAAAVLSARPEIPADVQNALGSKADAQDVTQLSQTITELQDMLNKMAAAPDPAQAPLRGIVSGAPGGAGAGAGNASGGVVPVERRSLVDEAGEQNRDEKFKFLKSLTASGDPNIREQAEAMIRKMLLG